MFYLSKFLSAQKICVHLTLLTLNFKIMAISQNPITGRMKNKLGNAVASTWNGLNIIKSKALSVANPNTDAQKVNRERLRYVSHIGKIFAIAVMYGYRTVPVGSSARSFCNKQNYPFVTVSSPGAPPTISYPNLKPSIGGLSKVAPSSYAINGGDTAVVASFPASVQNPDESVNDDICLQIAVIPTTGDSINKFVKTKRSVGTLTASFGITLSAGDEVHAYLFASSALSAKASESVYYNTTV